MKKILFPILFIPFFLNAQNTLKVEINSQYNDIEVRANNTVDITSSDLELAGRDGLTSQETFLRFENINLPQDAVINHAYLVFYGDENSSTSSIIKITGEIGNSSAYPTSTSSTSGASIKARNYSSQYVNWENSGCVVNQQYQSPDLKNVLQEMFPAEISNANLAFRLQGNEQGAFTVRSYSSANYRPALVIEYNSAYGSNQVTVATGYDDAKENSSGSVALSYAYHNLGGRTDGNTSAIRFQNVQIPADAQISDAYIEFYSYGTSPAGNTKIYSELGNPEIYAASNGNISSRSYSANSINWATENWTSARVQYRTPNLKNLIDENRLSGWNSGENLAFEFEGQSTDRAATVYSYDGGSNYRPKLVVEYINNNEGPSIDGAITDPAFMDKLYINELSSQGTLTQKEDWIELYNGSDDNIHIKGGVYLSNKNKSRTLHELKNIFIPAHGYAVLIADENVDNNMHLNFELKNSGGTIYLSRKVNNEIVQQDSVDYTEIPYNQSYGKFPDGTGNLTNFILPTYKATNNQGQQRLDISFGKERGIYPSGFDLSISAPAGTTVKYTLDGKTPSETSGTLYTSPIPINSTSVVRVYAYNAAGNSGVITNTYVLQDNYNNENTSGGNRQWNYKSNITASEYAQAIGSIPVIAVSTDSQPTSNWSLASFEYIDNNVYSGRSNFSSSTMTKKFGQVSIGQYNSGIKFKFNSDAGVKKAKYTFFDKYPGDVYETPDKIQTIELKEGQDGPQNNIYNLGFMRYSEKIVMNLQKEMQKYALDTRFVNLFINGKYRGLKTMRNDFKPNNIEEVFGDDSDNYTKVNLQDGYFTYGTVEDGDGLASVWTNIRNTATSKNFQEFKKLVDVDDLIKFQIMFMFIDTENEATVITHNTNPDIMKAKFIINDTDGAFFGGNTASSSNTIMTPRALAGGGGNYKYKWQLSSSRNGAGALFGQFMGSNANTATGNLEFKTLVKDAVLKYMGSASGDFEGADGAPLSVARVQQKMTETVNELDILYKLDAAYMGYSTNVYNQWKTVDYPRILAQVPERVEFSLKKWLEYDMAHTLSAVEIVSEGQTVTLNNPNPNTNLYYTLNGTDPMGADGVISEDAALYADPITLSQGKYNIMTRAFATNNWGPVSDKTIEIGNSAQNRIVAAPKEMLQNEIKIYPNPVKETLFIETGRKSNMAVYSLDGKMIQQIELKEGKHSINVETWGSGIYLVKISDENGSRSFKIIKK